MRKLTLFTLIGLILLISPCVGYTVLSDYTVGNLTLTSTGPINSVYFNYTSGDKDFYNNITKIGWEGYCYADDPSSMIPKTSTGLTLGNGANSVGNVSATFSGTDGIYRNSTTCSVSITFNNKIAPTNAWSGANIYYLNGSTWFPNGLKFYYQEPSSSREGVNEVRFGYSSPRYAGHYTTYTGTAVIDPPVCDFEISPYPADPGTTLTLNDLSTGDPNGYGWMVLPPIGPWDNESLGIASDAYYTLGQFGQYTFAHEVHNAGGTVQCSYDYWSGTNYTAFNVTPTLVGNLTTNITSTNISGQFAPLNLTLIDKPFFKNQLDNMTYFGNYSSAWTGFIDNMTESVNVTFNEVEARINPFNFLTDIIMNSHNLFVVIFIPLLGYVIFPLAITSAVINIIPQPIQLLISLGLLVDLFFLVLRGPD